MVDTPDDLGPVPPGARTGPADRLLGLIDAHRVITSDTDLSKMLERIVYSACRLVGAGYGVLGVLGDDGTLDRSVQHGRLTGSTAEQVVLEVPIEVGGTVFGNLFLADPVTLRFTAEDEEFAGALAAVAGTAVKNARLFADVRRSNDWLAAAGDVARGLLDADGSEINALVVERAVQVAGADYGTLIMPTPDGRLRATHTVGVGAQDFRDVVFSPGESRIGRAVLEGQSALIEDLTTTARAGFENRWNYGAAMLVPLADPDGVRGAILLVRTRGRQPFTERDTEMGSVFAAQVALALQLEDARVQREELRSLEVRHGIAKDLHDNVIQRLFAIGVGLQGVQNAAGAQLTADVGDRLAAHVLALDETIEQIRSRVFDLRQDERAARPPDGFPRVRTDPALPVTGTAPAHYTD